VSSSRSFQFSTGTYELNEDGGFAPMSSTAQRVVLLVAFASKLEKFITPQALNSAKDRVRKALRVLTDGETPAIKLLSIENVRTAPGVTRLQITFKDNTTGLNQTVVP
jgi:hypothetical protein